MDTRIHHLTALPTRSSQVTTSIGARCLPFSSNPHHRDRLYVVGIRADVQIRAFQFPTPFPRQITLEQLLGPGVEPKKDLASMTVDADGSMLSNTVRKNLAQFQKEVSQKNILHADWIVDCGESKPTCVLGKCPCLILSRCKGKHGYWSQLHQRFLGPKDFSCSKASLCIPTATTQ